MRKLVAEWEKQEGVIVALPTKDSDWRDYFGEVMNVYKNIIYNISKYEKVYLITNDTKSSKALFGDSIEYIEVKINDTWCRDYAPIFVKENNKIKALNFIFNGWGLKFASNYDNMINFHLQNQKFLDIEFETIGIVLEGGSIDYNSQGTLLTNTQCLLEKNRNPHLSRDEIDKMLKKTLGAKEVLWLNSGYLIGDDTNSHIDTLARFIDDDTIVYIKCYDKSDVHFSELEKMECELRELKREDGRGFKLIPLPLNEPIYYDSQRLPASYANFLFINGALLLPTYNQKSDQDVIEIFKNLLPNREIIPINCEPLIRQHGSLHCVTMQVPSL